MDRKTSWRPRPESRNHFGPWSRDVVSESDLVVAGIRVPEVDITLSADPDDCSGGSDVLWTLRDGLGDIVCRYLERQRERQYPESPR